jgi:two-component system, sensor histidine kinase and response regulator
MLKTAFHSFIQFWQKIANIGVTEGLRFHEKKKIQVLNVVVACGLPFNIFFCVLNLSQHKIWLGIINFCLLIGGIIILVTNSYRNYLTSRLIVTFLASILFSAGAIFYRNGGEYFLLANLIIIIIFFKEKKLLLVISFINCLLFLLIKYILHTGFVYDALPYNRVLINMSLSLVIMVLALYFFKTEQLDYQELIEEKNKELKNMNETKQKLFSIIAHDLRSPISQLKGSLDLVNQAYLSPEEFGKITKKLSVDVDLLHSTLDNLLRWSISQFQGIVASPEKIILTDAIEKQAALFFRPALEAKNLNLHLELGSLAVWADPDHFNLVMRNLLSNAIKYSYENGGILVRSSQTGSEILLEIRDQGMGIEASLKAHVFQTENLISSTGTSNEKGTGLGLKLCKEFIEINQGRIWVESEPDKGSCFYFSLPAAKEEPLTDKT